MDISDRDENGITIVTIEGRLDAAQAPAASKAIEKILKGSVSRLLFDLGGLEYLSSGGLRVILGAAKEMKRSGGKIILCSLNEYVKEIFEVSGFDSLIPISATVEEGIQRIS
ncbi:MAG: STAS domain-containing protein [Desulfobacterales bacterium]|jgi:anti-anti-sigma factor